MTNLLCSVPGEMLPLADGQLFFRHGPPTFLTCRTPLGETTPNLGDLMYLSDSRCIGEQMEQESTNKPKISRTKSGRVPSAEELYTSRDQRSPQDKALLPKFKAESSQRSWLD
jgi:hypothetical protein